MYTIAKLHFSRMLFGAVFALATLPPLSNESEAADRTLLDSLEQKGLITHEEAAAIAKESAVQVLARPTTKSLRLSSRFQIQYEWLDSEAYSGGGSPAYGSANGFNVRRFFLQADADLGGGWQTRFSVDLARSELTSIFTDTYLSKKIESQWLDGKLILGYTRPGFALEDMTSSFAMTAIERSAATMYWTGDANNRRLGVGSRYMGVHWRGNIRQVEGLSYNLSITNAYQFSPTEIEERQYCYRDNKLAYWAGVHYAVSAGDFKLKCGLYSMYSTSANYNMGLVDSASIGSINPYFTGNFGDLYFWGDYLASIVADGKTSAGGAYEQANPYGLNFAVEYRFDIGEYGKIAPTFRYSWVDTNGRGIRINDAQRHSPRIGSLYDNVQEFYAGVNWYFDGELKVKLGYSYAQFSGDCRGGNAFADSSSVRIQFQMRL